MRKHAKLRLSLMAILLLLANPALAQESYNSAPMPALADTQAHITEPNYAIRAGDVLQVTVWKEDGMDREVLVLPDGTIAFPLIGSLNVEGQTLAQAQADIKEKLKAFIPDASVTVMVKAALGHAVSVIGQVAKPGEILITHELTVMQALSQAGGLTPYASEGGIRILRRVNGKETAIKFDYGDVEDGEHLESDIALEPGDVVVVPTAGLL